MSYKSILDKYIEKVIVINLLEAVERKQKILIQLEKIFDKNKIIILEAFKNEYTGATQSHINCLKLAIKNKWKNVLILEDDACFTNNCTNLFEKLIKNNFDVLHLGGQNVLFNPFTNRLYVCYGGVAYIVNNHYLEVLMKHYEEGLQKIKNIKLFEKDTYNHGSYIFDSYWRILQSKDNWKICYPPIFIQKKGYSYVNKEIRDFENDFYDVNFNFIEIRLYNKLRKDHMKICKVFCSRFFHLLFYLMIVIFNKEIEYKVICGFFLCSNMMFINYNFKNLNSWKDINNLEKINNLLLINNDYKFINKYLDLVFIYNFIYYMLFHYDLKIHFVKLSFRYLFLLFFHIPVTIYNIVFSHIRYK